MSYSKDAFAWAEKNLIGKSIYHPELNKKILFTRRGVRHAIAARSNRLKSVFIYDVMSLLKNAKLIDIKKDRKGRKQIKNVYILYVDWVYGGVDYFAKIVVREGVNGAIYYDHVILKKKKP